MLNKKAIAAFAAGATLVSGLVLATPAMAKTDPHVVSNPPVVQGDQVTALDNVVFNFKVGDKDHKTTAMTLYKKGDKYGADKSDIAHTVAEIGAGLLAQVQNDLTPAQGDSVVDTGTVAPITYPATITAGENTVTVTLTYKSDVSDDVVTTMAGRGDFKTFEATLKQQKKKISPAQKTLFDTQRAKVEKDKAKKAALIAEAERFGLPKNVVDALKHYAESKESAAVAKLLEQGKRNAIEELAKKAEKEGFTFVAKQIRNSKKSTLTALKALLAEAEKSKKQKPTPVPSTPVPPAPVPSQPNGNSTGTGTGTGTGNGAGSGADNTNSNKTTKNDATKNAANVAAPLAKTGAAVALAAVAASVLAGMGAALRKIRH